MGYADYLKNTLKPLRVYELDTGIGAAELEAEGAAMDRIDGILSSTCRNMLPMSADARGLAEWEKLFPYALPQNSIADRRTALMAMIRMGECECSEQGMNFVLASCGIPANVSETAAKETLKVTILNDNLSGAELQRLKNCIEAILPCHLDIIYE